MILLAFAFTYVVGWIVLRRSGGSGIPVLPALALSFTCGAAALSLQLLLYDLAHVPWRWWTIVALWALIVAVRLYRHRPALPRPKLGWSWPQWLEWPALIFAALVLLAWAPYERLMPLKEWDAVMLWMFKGKAFYQDGGVAPYMARAHEFLGNPAYPLLVPLYTTYLYVWDGQVADHAAKFFSPCFYASLLAGMWYVVRRFGSRPVAGTATSMLMGIYMVNFTAFHYAGYADTAVSAAILLGAGCLYAWFREDRHEDFTLAILFGSIAAWTKNEGLFFLGGAGILAGARLLWQRKWDWRLWTSLAGFPALAVVPWAAARSLYGIKRPGQLSSEIVQTNVASYWPTLKALVEHAFVPSVFNLVFPAWLLSLVLFRRAGLDWRFLVLPALVLWQLFGVTLVYVTGPVNLQWMIGSSLDRVLSQIAPLALLSAALVLSAWYERAEARAAKPVTKKRRK